MWLVEKDFLESELMCQALEDTKTPYKLVSYHDIIDYSRAEKSKRFVYSSINGALVYYRKKLCENLDYLTYVGKLGDEALNYYSNIMTYQIFKNRIRNKDYIYTDIFIKPISPVRTFPGTLLHISQVNDFIANCELLKVPNSELIFVSPLDKYIQEEYRFVVINKEIITCSKYRDFLGVKIDNKVPDKAIGYTKKIISMFNPQKGYIIDVCMRRNGEYKVVEYNSIHTSGLYACDRVKFAEAVNKCYL